METKTTHTPGPWHLHKVDKGRGKNGYQEHYRIIGVREETVLIAEVYHNNLEWEEYEANARLIALAPEMVELLNNAPLMAGHDLDCGCEHCEFRGKAIILLARLENNH